MYRWWWRSRFDASPRSRPRSPRFGAGAAFGWAELAILSVETASDAMLATGRSRRPATVLISGQRGAALGLGNQLDAASSAPITLARSDWLDAATARALADPGRDLDRFLAGPLAAVPVDQPYEAKAALRLARLAGLLPALWLVDDAGAFRRRSHARRHLPARDSRHCGAGQATHRGSRRLANGCLSRAGDGGRACRVADRRAGRRAALGPTA